MFFSKFKFIDACMLAGTEYCLTYPFLNIDQYQPQNPAVSGASRFNFDAAVTIVKNAPLINWLQTFPTEDMKNDHVEGYCACKVLLKHNPVYNIFHNKVEPLSHCAKGNGEVEAVLTYILS